MSAAAGVAIDGRAMKSAVCDRKLRPQTQAAGSRGPNAIAQVILRERLGDELLGSVAILHEPQHF